MPVTTLEPVSCAEFVEYPFSIPMWLGCVNGGSGIQMFIVTVSVNGSSSDLNLVVVVNACRAIGARLASMWPMQMSTV